MRAFVAIQLDTSSRAAAARWSERLRTRTPPGAVSLVAPEVFHLTLKFLGNVPDDQGPALTRAIEKAVADIPAFDLALQGLGAFPSVDRARVLWIGVDEGTSSVASWRLASKRNWSESAAPPTKSRSHRTSPWAG